MRALCFLSVKWVLLSIGNSDLWLRGFKWIKIPKMWVSYICIPQETTITFYVCILHMLTTSTSTNILSHTEQDLGTRITPTSQSSDTGSASHILEAGHEARPQNNRSSYSPNWGLCFSSWGVTQLNPTLCGKADEIITTGTTNQQ